MTRLALDTSKASWKAQCKDLEDANALLEKTALEEKANAQKDFDNWRLTANTRHNAEKISLAMQFDKKLKKADALASNWRSTANTRHDAEKIALAIRFRQEAQGS